MRKGRRRKIQYTSGLMVKSVLRTLNHTGVEMGAVSDGADVTQFPERNMGRGDQETIGLNLAGRRLQNILSRAGERSDSLDAWPDAIPVCGSLLTL